MVATYPAPAPINPHLHGYTPWYDGWKRIWHDHREATMARPIWTGVISFGLVSVPIELYPATQDHDVSFHQFQKGTKDRIRYQRVNERTGKPVDFADIVRGAEVGGGHVLLDQDELDAIAPGRSRSVDIETFVDQDEIDPIYYQKTYYLAPGSDETAKTYALLRDAMSAANRAAIGTFVMRSKQYLATIRPDGDLLVLETMFFADEVREPEDTLRRVPGKPRLTPAELKMATQLIKSMSGKWDPDEFRDNYTDDVHALIKAKSKGKSFAPAAEAPAATGASDLMEVLRQSVAAAKSGRAGARSAPATTTAKNAKPTAKKARNARPTAKTAKPAAKKARPKAVNSARTAPAKAASAARKTTAKAGTPTRTAKTTKKAGLAKKAPATTKTASAKRSAARKAA
jgi:DNA end-binding protein Ku